MKILDRRQFLTAAAALGASFAWAGSRHRPSSVSARERRDLYPQGVASADPDAHGVLLWTRRPYAHGSQARLTVEVAEDAAFSRVIATANVRVLAVSDWTCRVLVGNLEPASVYWYRFIDATGNASRTGRTLTAPAEDDSRPVSFAFVSCQWICSRALNTYRRMIFDDMRSAPSEQLGFILHLGDFAYKKLYYPADNPLGDASGVPFRDVGRLPQGQRMQESDKRVAHVPATLDDYRALYRIYLNDPDLQDARARWPFVCIWDNGEFAWEGGYQTVLYEEGNFFPAQSHKVMANQAWFEYIPARVSKSSGPSLERFDPPQVSDAPISRFDADGFGDEPNNRAALASLTAYRSLRFGANVDLFVTDQWSYRTPDAAHEPGAESLKQVQFAVPVFEQEALEALDAGPPQQSLLGVKQKAWFLDQLKRSRATWKIWGSSLAAFEVRLDLQHLADPSVGVWPGKGYAQLPQRDYGVHFRERAEIYAHVRKEGIRGFALVSGDKHSFWAGLAAPALPPERFEPVGVAFVTGSVSSYTPVQYLENNLPRDSPLRRLYFGRAGADGKPQPTYNMLVRHGVRSVLEYGRSGDLARARALSNRELSPHLRFTDLDGNGYATVRATPDMLECEFICIAKPVERAAGIDGGPLRYRIRHRASLWKSGETPALEQHVVEGDPALSI